MIDQCLDGRCESVRRAGLPVQYTTPAALSAQTLGMRIISSHGVCGHTDKRIYRLSLALHVLVHRRRAVDRGSSLVWRHCLARSCEHQSCAGPLLLLKGDWTNRWCPEVYCPDASEKREVLDDVETPVTCVPQTIVSVIGHQSGTTEKTLVSAAGCISVFPSRLFW